MKKPTYQQYCHCFIVSILGPYEFWFSFQLNKVTIVISTTFRGVALNRGRSLFEAWHLLEEIQYL